MCPSRWFTPTRGRRRAKAIALATETPTSSDPTSPGPTVTARAVTSPSVIPASARARSRTGWITSMWRREASSGTIPPYGACRSTCEATTLLRTRRPPSRTAAAVSSHDVSMPSTHSIGWQSGNWAIRQSGVPSCRVPPGCARLPACQGLELAGGLLLGLGRGAVLLQDPHGLQDLDGSLELDVLLYVHDVPASDLHPLALLLADLLLPRRLARRDAARLLFPFLLALRCHLRPGLLHHDVGHDPRAVNGAAQRRVVLGRGQTQTRPIRERDHGLHRALAEGLGPQDHRPLPVLQGAGHNLRGAGRAAVDQDHHGPSGVAVAVLGREAEILVLEASLRVDDELPLVQEHVGHRHRLVQQAARVVAQIQDQGGGAALPGLLHRLLQVLGRPLLERGEPDVIQALPQVFVADALDLDGLADQGDVEGLRPPLPEDADGHLGSLGPAELAHRVHQGHVLGGLVLDLDDAVTGLDAGAIRRRAVDGGDDGEHPVLHRDLDAQAPEAPLGLHLHLPEGIGRHEGTVRIQGFQHALDRAVDQFLGVHLVHVVGLDQRQDLGEDLEFLVGVLDRRGAMLHPAGEDQEHQRPGEDDTLEPTVLPDGNHGTTLPGNQLINSTTNPAITTWQPGNWATRQPGTPDCRVPPGCARLPDRHRFRPGSSGAEARRAGPAAFPCGAARSTVAGPPGTRCLPPCRSPARVTRCRRIGPGSL